MNEKAHEINKNDSYYALRSDILRKITFRTFQKVKLL